jgi:predicted alpha/beta-fold hydrolase
VGFTKDVNHLVRMLRERFPHKKLYLSGFSLGGNVSLKFLGELGADAQARGVYGAAVTCVPFDAAACQKKMDTNDFNRSVYAAVSTIMQTHLKLHFPFKTLGRYFAQI